MATKAELLEQAETMGLDVTSDNTVVEIEAAIAEAEAANAAARAKADAVAELAKAGKYGNHSFYEKGR